MIWRWQLPDQGVVDVMEMVTCCIGHGRSQGLQHEKEMLWYLPEFVCQSPQTGQIRVDLVVFNCFFHSRGSSNEFYPRYCVLIVQGNVMQLGGSAVNLWLVCPSSCAPFPLLLACFITKSEHLFNSLQCFWSSVWHICSRYHWRFEPSS